MKKSLAHLPPHKQAELILITEKIAHIVPQAELIFLFASYPRRGYYLINHRRRACPQRSRMGRFLNQFNFWFFQDIYHNHKNAKFRVILSVLRSYTPIGRGADFLPTARRLPVQGRVVPKYVENAESGTTTQQSQKIVPPQGTVKGKVYPVRGFVQTS